MCEVFSGGSVPREKGECNEPLLVNRKQCSQPDSRVLTRWRLRRRIQRLLFPTLGAESGNRILRCGFAMNPLVALLGGKGKATWSGVEHCNSIWACPVCSARIREGRRSEILRGVRAARERGWGMLFITFTVPHSVETPLKDSLGGLLAAFRRLKRYSALRGFWNETEGFIRATEVQVGSNGFHPHLHTLFFVESVESVSVEALKQAWARAVVAEGLARPSDGVGVVVEQVEKDADAVAEYLVKKQENKISLELARSDLKSGRRGRPDEWHCSPFDLLNPDVDLPLSSEVRSALFVEFFKSTKGRRCIEWSRGLKADLLIQEVADEKLGSLSQEEQEAQLRWLREAYRELFRQRPSVLAEAQALFVQGKYEEAQALAGGELILCGNS